MVDSKQAEALQLATDNGSISLAIRNPLDKKMVDMEATVLSQGRLANLGAVLTPAVFSFAENAQNEQISLEKQTLVHRDIQSEAQEDNETEIVTMEKPVISDEKYQMRQYPRWGVTVIRGCESTVEELDIQQSEHIAVTN